MVRGRIVPNLLPSDGSRITWEYLEEGFSRGDANQRGKDGWELVDVYTLPGRGDSLRARAVYKRSIEPSTVEPTQQSQNEPAEPTSAQATLAARVRGAVKFADGQPLHVHP
jgi:hypothetical protein